MSFKSFLLVSAFVVLPLASAHAQDQQAQAIKNMEMRLSAIEEQMRMLTGKSEKIDYMLQRFEETLQKLQEDTDTRLTQLEKRPVPTATAQPPAQSAPQQPPSVIEAPPQTPSQTQTQGTIEGTLGGVKMRDGRVVGAIVDPKAPPLPDKPADYGLTARESYDRAFDLLRQADYAEAQRAFKSFIDKFPQDKLVENAKYWYAETFYVQGHFSDAAVAFAEAYQAAPSGGKAPDSLLKLAMALGSVGKVKDACSTLDALKVKFPQSSSAIKDRMKEERARFKCP